MTKSSDFSKEPEPAGEETPLVLLAGPTASGKTSLAIEPARHIPAEIVNADSMQVYRHMDIETAKRQITWFRGDPEFRTFDADDLDGIYGCTERAVRGRAGREL